MLTLTFFRFGKNILLSMSICCLVVSVVGAQMARKPSPSRAGGEGMTTVAVAKRFLSAISSQADFDQMARVYNAKTPYALPHAMLVIDGRNKNKIAYVNSHVFRFHAD